MSMQGKTYVGCVPFFGATNWRDGEPHSECWRIGFNDEEEAESYGAVEVTILEILDSAVSGRIAIYTRTYLDPDGELVTKPRKKIGPLGSVKAYITKWDLHELPAAGWLDQGAAA